MTVEQFRKKLTVAGIDLACQKLGLPFEEMFLEYCSGGQIPYGDYYWCVYTTTDPRINPNIYIHAIPDPDASPDMPWEEWFVMEGTLEHHACYPQATARTNHIVNISLEDRDHPLYTMGKTWHWYIDPDLTPILYR